jgi:hypothetical protein
MNYVYEVLLLLMFINRNKDCFSLSIFILHGKTVQDRLLPDHSFDYCNKRVTAYLAI